MRNTNHKFQNTRGSSFFTPETHRKTATHRNNLSLVSPNLSQGKKMQMARKDFSFQLNGEENPEIYFDKTKRKTFIKSLIDGYFKQPMSTIQLFEQSKINVSPLLQNGSIVRKNVYSSDCVRRNNRNKQIQANNPSKNRVIEINLSTLRDADRLPTINQSQFQQRPSSDYQPYRRLSKRPSSPFSPILGSNQSDLTDSFFLDSNKSLFDSKLEQIDKDDYLASRIQSKILKKKQRNFGSLDDEQLIRQKLVNKLGLPVMWKTSKEATLEYPLLKKTLREMLYNIVQEKRGDEPLFLIFPTQYYYNLFANKCEQIFDIIKAMCKLVVKGHDKISNNQIHVNNIHKIQEKNFLVYDWGCAGIAETLQVQGVKYPKFHSPYTRKNEQWLLSPEYLAPQLLRAIQYDSFEHLWGQKGGIGSCDVWSIGCLLFELITLIPINHPHHCVIKGKQYSRRGLMGTKIRTVQNIIAKQKYLRSLVLRRVKDYLRQKDSPIIDSKLLHILPKMLEQDPSKRITAAQVISILG